jgi:hypothetical protein
VQEELRDLQAGLAEFASQKLSEVFSNLALLPPDMDGDTQPYASLAVDAEDQLRGRDSGTTYATIRTLDSKGFDHNRVRESLSSIGSNMSAASNLSALSIASMASSASSMAMKSAGPVKTLRILEDEKNRVVWCDGATALFSEHSRGSDWIATFWIGKSCSGSYRL